MVSFIASLAVVVIFAAIVYRFAPTRGQRAAELLERYRPHAPMSDWSLSYYDDRRQYSELVAIRAHRESEAAVTRAHRESEATATRVHGESEVNRSREADRRPQSACGIGRGAVQF
ncbi:hypothetical protein [Nocardia mexicana]|uniref:Uncharacterized protein n=1 Tax=Nocardia mexicana TaxID=279262 RepID=A0A370GSF9_9NOCA|nr:hypothetical protein [Nocardia mexicana]RDI46627.1 hypothetical protein DFR68_11032 [Nocardia mexicana]